MGQQESGNEKNHNKQRWLRGRWKVKLKVHVFSFYSDVFHILITLIDVHLQHEHPGTNSQRQILCRVCLDHSFTVVTSGNNFLVQLKEPAFW